jgi:uncharacterized membrane protein
MPTLYVPALLVAVLITALELTEVVALVFAFSADAGTIRPTALGATGGTATIALIALAAGAAILAAPHQYLLWGSAIALAGFGAFLFRSTLRSYRRAADARAGLAATARPPRSLQFAGGFTVGAIESTEVAVVLLALAAAGYGLSALVGALLGGAALVVAATFVHERIRRLKVPWLKLGATSVLLAFATFWAGEAAGFSWPAGDLVLIPLAVLFGLVIRGAIAWLVRGSATAAAPSG